MLYYVWYSRLEEYGDAVEKDLRLNNTCWTADAERWAASAFALKQQNSREAGGHTRFTTENMCLDRLSKLSIVRDPIPSYSRTCPLPLLCKFVQFFFK